MRNKGVQGRSLKKGNEKLKDIKNKKVSGIGFSAKVIVTEMLKHEQQQKM